MPALPSSLHVPPWVIYSVLTVPDSLVLVRLPFASALPRYLPRRPCISWLVPAVPLPLTTVSSPVARVPTSLVFLRLEHILRVSVPRTTLHTVRVKLPLPLASLKSLRPI